MTTIIESLEQQIADLQKQLEEAKARKASESPWVLAPVGLRAFEVGSILSGYASTGMRESGNDFNAFKEESVAKGFANAFHVMIALRQCEGAGQVGHQLDGYAVFRRGNVERLDRACPSYFSVFPPFPTPELAHAAADKVGRDKIAAAYKFLATGEV